MKTENMMQAHTLDPVSAPLPTAPADELVRILIAEELDRVRLVLEEMGVQLCADPAVVRSHLAALQRIDELCQRHENLARILRADDMAAEAAGVTLESLRLRLKPALARPFGGRGEGVAGN